MQSQEQQKEHEFDPRLLIAPKDFIAHWNEKITDEEYHADLTSVGSTQVRKVLDSPAAFWASYNNPKTEQQKEEEESECLSDGKMVHMAILENERFKQVYQIMPEFMGMTQDGKMSAQSKAAKDKRAAWLADLPPGAKVVEPSKLRMIIGIAEAIVKHPQGKDLISDCQTEVAGYYRDPETGIKCRFKPDLLKRSLKAMTDFKTAKSSDWTFFGSQAFQHRYDIQLCMYREGVKAITGQYPELLSSLVVEKTPPYEPAIYYWDKEDLVQAEVDYRAGLRKLKWCIDNNKWPFRQQMIQRIRTPQWFIYDSTNKG